MEMYPTPTLVTATLPSDYWNPTTLAPPLPVATPIQTFNTVTVTKVLAAPPAPVASCKTHYWGVLDSFEIWGTNWDQAKLDGQGSYLSGRGLLQELEGCGDVTKWKFHVYDPQDSSNTGHWQWRAQGRTTIWQKRCIEHAMVSGGAPNMIRCSGSG